ncbi:putative tRNA 5-methylaminomethyl-2-thiouridine biosynthesis bifunctional protein MnmC (Includes: tRNA (mnm(5)s(2)U34)-methyltransferase; FAD-dependent cmnm(5)s(2)U34 oxidoreductase) [Candidatus Terasakiella magnetica]|uniref:tRNA 5-methylaminomethyl-2-thiouridine biosynthesis bifunctional protein MnmC n=1 Tax=Candidatus Terasakiella magnetica TaxID=1867952 RepID=A0A1C3RC70_9PROT|nr:bifunctional tRNA (5-methylaminomethyl-2-thiouridine)(34)-methyltransferase MnmD/FAD-dependent 5-carboxymethylaminomethyl-2-thiouridine(34) oxidoreductase MnmC [Candidatus Terasakiella magnetica]SCA54877.1 putative tRNA 5-methylaminomethyl-2-thiouridine biosynthesis bifunctional protein MnmC (Includes: tRNA (mnm(5)s(2)U34)-methyltransferase; FAD-dependent cmnm(5)s(2)U34 oxidoreductase) [Candidatus Terasakiella magnetica]
MSELASPQLSWKENKTPVSDRFDDVYFSADDGIAESLYVFIHGCGMPEAFEGKNAFTVGETGFGTGLNFLLTWKEWREAKTDCQLHYISVEAFPLSKEELAQAYQTFEGLDEYGEEFLKHYPVNAAGFHHIVLDEGRVKLTLMFGEAAEMFAQVEGEVDAWYLDGFAPSKNPEMWRAEVFEQLGRLSKEGAIISTFTAAGFVKRGLQAVGFEMRKRNGYGRKRESLIGALKVSNKQLKNKWYFKPLKSFVKQKIAVIGGGIAGALTARRLLQDGHEVVIFERNDQAGLEGSGNRMGLIKPRVSLDRGFNIKAYLSAVSFYDNLDIDVWKGPRGIFELAKDSADVLRHKMVMEKNILPSSEIRHLSKEEASEMMGTEMQGGGLWFPNAGYVEPSNLCQALTSKMDIRTGVTITKISKQDDQWQLLSGEDIVFEGDAVVMATAGENAALNDYCDLAMRARRGQVSYVKATKQSEKLKYPLTGGGYLLPCVEGEHIIGATFEHWKDFFEKSYTEVTEVSHEKNREKLKTFFPDMEFEFICGRASMRAMTPDHNPIVGPIYSKDWYVKEYSAFMHGPRAKNFAPAEYVEGLYVICGLGARGMQTAPLLADVLSSYIAGTHCPVENRYREMLHPARSLMREIKKAKP